ncbi:MAG: phosphate ABC transporter permease PstA [Clostridiales bacterium]|jgi:phosphate transport system permease protein|nr:phosphate ABC transporter permease PstA [Clostridiales bacterium]
MKSLWGPGSSPQSFFLRLVTFAAAAVSMLLIAFLVLYILVMGVPHITPSLFELSYTSENVSLVPAFINTVSITFFTLLIAAPLGILAAVWLAEYAKRGSRLVKAVRLAAETLSGIPSIVYGLFGMLMFVGFFKWRLSLIAGAFTLAVMVLPLIMRTTEESLMSVPDTFREGSFGLGAGKLRTVFFIVLPSAMPGILAGVILATGRIMGETAALIYTAGTKPEFNWNVFESARTLAVHMYVLSGEGLHVNQTYATAVVLLILVIGVNSLSAWLAKKIAGEQNG